MRIDLADIRVRTGLTSDCRTRLTIEYPTEELYRRCALRALSAFFNPDVALSDQPIQADRFDHLAGEAHL